MGLVLGFSTDKTQRCSFCLDRTPAPYMLSHEYIRELKGNPNRPFAHLPCIEARQHGLRQFTFVKMLLDDNENYCTNPYSSNNEVVLEDTPEGRRWVKDSKGDGLAFFWAGKPLFIEPKRGIWLREYTTYPRNIMIALDDDRWWLYLPKNQALMFKLTWGGEIRDV